MGIARAIRRVKRQAKQGGLNAVMSGLGEGLRSGAVPAPLRGAARKIASFIDPSRGSHKSRPPKPGHDPLPQPDPGIARPPAEVTLTGVDSGAEPAEPVEGTPVDAAAVGATPSYNATPVEVAPVDASPTVVTASEVKAVEVSLADAPYAEPDLPDVPAAAAPETPAATSAKKPSAEKGAAKKAPAEKAAAKKKTAGHGEPKPAKKEKLAQGGETAKSLARSGSQGSKKPASPRADTTSKKK